MPFVNYHLGKITSQFYLYFTSQIICKPLNHINIDPLKNFHRIDQNKTHTPPPFPFQIERRSAIYDEIENEMHGSKRENMAELETLNSANIN